MHVIHSGKSNWFRRLAAVQQYLRILRQSCKYVLGWILPKESEFDNRYQGGSDLAVYLGHHVFFARKNGFLTLGAPPPYSPPDNTGIFFGKSS